MTKVSRSFYSAAVSHKELDGIYLAMFAIAGESPQWVTDSAGKPKFFTSAQEAELAGFKVIMTKLNRAREAQDFVVRNRKNGIKSFHAPLKQGEPTVASVFGKKP